jgi:DNA-binding response OmpR family regulator
VLEFLKTLASPPPVIMITANEGGRHKAYAEMLGVVEYLRKPFAIEAMLDAVQRALTPPAPPVDPGPPGAGPLKRSRTTKRTG